MNLTDLLNAPPDPIEDLRLTHEEKLRMQARENQRKKLEQIKAAAGEAYEHLMRHARWVTDDVIEFRLPRYSRFRAIFYQWRDVFEISCWDVMWGPIPWKRHTSLGECLSAARKR